MSIQLNSSRFIFTVTANDLEQSMRFYLDGLGFTVDEEYRKSDGKLDGVTVKAGSALIGLVQDDFAKGRDRVKGVAMSLYLETDQDIAALAKQAAEAGIAVTGPQPLHWGPMSFSVVDPDGFRLYIANTEK